MKREIAASLRVLERSKTSAIEEKRRAFALVRDDLVPVTNRTKEYAAELSRVFSLRFPLWLTSPEAVSEVDNNSIIADRIRGLLFGAALGDSIGLSTEFMTHLEVERNYEPDHMFRPSSAVYPDFHRINFPAGDWTDDTDQMILILQTLLENQGRYNGSNFANKMVNWKNHGFPGLGDQSGAGLGRTTREVLNHKEFTTDPQLAAKEIWERGGRTGAANGAVMRTAITGVPFFWDADIVRCNTVDFCEATHTDPRCVASCLVVAECIRRLLLRSVTSCETGRDTIIEEIIASAVESSIVNLEGSLDEVAADELRRYSETTSIYQLDLDGPGKIGYTFKCVGCGIWALREAAASIINATAFVGSYHSSNNTNNDSVDVVLNVVKDVLQQIVRAGGDADTNGAVAGALLGAFLGFDALPWTNELPYGGWLEAWTQKLLFMCRLPVTSTRKTDL